MMSLSHTFAPPGRGRPRDDAREQAILDAALELLTEVGFERMSMVSVAARAHASKATIYRRWPGKTELVVEAVRRRHQRETTAIDTGSMRGDMLAMVRTMIDAVSKDDLALLVGVLLAMRNSPELAAALCGPMLEEKRCAGEAVVGNAIARGELPPDADASVLAEVAPAVMLTRLLINPEPVDDAFVNHLVDDIMIPLVLHGSVSSDHVQPTDPSSGVAAKELP